MHHNRAYVTADEQGGVPGRAVQGSNL
jgi:hypothetical protein